MQNIDKIKSKIKKLLAMSESTSPNEAAIAARQAKAMMDNYKLSRAECEDVVISAEDYVTVEVTEMGRRFPKWKSILGPAVARYTSTLCKAKGFRPYAKMVFQGHREDLMLAEYLYTYLVRSIDNAVKTHKITGRSFIASFRYGMASEISRKLRDMRQEEKTEQTMSQALVRVETQKEAMLRKVFGVARYSACSTNASDRGGYALGAVVGSKVGIRSAVTKQGNAGLLN